MLSSPTNSPPHLPSRRRKPLSSKRRQAAPSSGGEDDLKERPKALKLLRTSSGLSELEHDFPVITTRVHRNPRRSDGLMNLVNTCYLNSALQVLRHTPEFVERLRRISIEKLERVKSHSGAQLLRAFLDTMEYLDRRETGGITTADDAELFGWRESRDSGVRPERLVGILRDGSSIFANRLQHDAHEFVMYILTSFEDAEVEIGKLDASCEADEAEAEGSSWKETEMGKAKTDPAMQGRRHDLTRDLFTGVTSQVVRCTDCRTQTCVTEEWCELGVTMSGNTAGRSLGYAIDRWAAVERYVVVK
ncbi:hypothetical protein BC938DRAFT_478719 [Jimgerdemannia flammicorona]|uniref:USP domain-containing protein n=1 Tax=Jimgerdemannia flammicorona TaxID=994334 RepID=A0A433QME9_9FUNG|nr:hypothetical protein BC938DRAFT_478719 [Jimgerdemannia flammicorona]